MEQLFSLLFKYRPFFFEKAGFTFQWPLPLWQIGLIAGALAAAVFFIYRRRWIASGQARAGWAMASVRLAFFLILLFLLMRPSLVLSTLVPRENLMVVLVDNSRSMSIPDEREVARGTPAQQILAVSSDFSRALNEKFQVRQLAFDQAVRRLSTSEELNWSGEQTNIPLALDQVLGETRNLPLAGVILISDGSDNSHREMKGTLAELRARKVPVHTVGVGPEAFDQDVEITQISAPRLLIPETMAVARVTMRHSGFGGHRGVLEVREGEALLQTQEVHFPRNAQIFSTEVQLIPRSAGTKTYNFNLRLLEGEQLAENNQRETVVRVEDQKPRILYVEGHPRWEYKFIRQAVADDKRVRLETLLRTALNKYYRQGIESETTLAAGFPTVKEELFQYRGLILGSIESSFFTYAQLEMIRDFVGQRGGGFLMLGGGSSFGAGQYQNTPLEEILPVWLQGEDAAEKSYEPAQARMQLTDYGRQHPVLQLGDPNSDTTQIWKKLPDVIDWNRAAGLKPGATVLAQIESEQENSPLLVFQRYGKGQSLAFLTGSTWRWQMLQDHQDSTHETFWRQVLRWLASSAADPVSIETEREIYSQGETVVLRAEVRDRTFNPMNDAVVEAIITSPGGEQTTLPMQWESSADGVYQASWVPAQDGHFRIQVAAENRSGSEIYGTGQSSFLTATGRMEYFDAVQKKEFLQKLSQETGGNHYTLDSVHNLPEEVLYADMKSSVVEVLDLWDMPINFLILTGLLFAEWMMRRRHGSI